MAVENKIAEVLLVRKWSQGELGKRAGVARTHVNAILRGHITPTLETALRLAQALKVPIETLFRIV